MEQLIFSIASPLRSLALATLAIGIAIVLTALIWLVQTRKRGAKPPLSFEILPQRTGVEKHWLVLLILLIAAGAALRLVGLGDKSLNHMEVYIPGIPLPAGISEPPPRHDWFSALTWGFFKEPHP